MALQWYTCQTKKLSVWNFADNFQCRCHVFYQRIINIIIYYCKFLQTFDIPGRWRSLRGRRSRWSSWTQPLSWHSTWGGWSSAAGCHGGVAGPSVGLSPATWHHGDTLPSFTCQVIQLFNWTCQCKYWFWNNVIQKLTVVICTTQVNTRRCLLHVVKSEQSTFTAAQFSLIKTTLIIFPH